MIRNSKKLSFRLSERELEEYFFLGRRVYCFDFSSLIRKALKELLERNPATNDFNGSPRPTTPALSDNPPSAKTSDKKPYGKTSDKSPGRRRKKAG